ncbi:MAG TPA: hotdog fold thioesterase [Burkholderiales bacterium]|nr:hotdog fold thioesterase [Burkholderiales bacterium]
MAIWFSNPKDSPPMPKGTMVENLGIEFLETGDDYLKARMPVDHRTRQPMGLLHGGASVALAETLGSIGAYLCVDPLKYVCVGLEINANHIRGVRAGWVYGIARPFHIGRTTHVWEIKITDEEDKLVCISRITIAILDRQ